MKIVSCAGYYNTGSSAVTDYLSEFDDVKSLGEAEYKFLQDCDGVSALEMNLIEHPHRHNTSHAIKRFIKASKFENGDFLSKRYRKIWGDKFMQYTMEYIDEITQLQTINFWRGDCIERGRVFYYLDALFTDLSWKLGKRYLTSILSLTHEKAYFTSISKEDFYAATKRYTSKLFNSVVCDEEFLMIDQLTSPSEISRYMNYVDNLFVIVVDRDPRDIFINTKPYPYWYKIPHRVEDFCMWYKIIREHRKTEKPCDKSILVYLEDMIYDYDNTTKKIRDFLGIEEESHICPKKYFDPSVSIRGTRLWDKNDLYRDEIKYIESALSEYLYHY